MNVLFNNVRIGEEEAWTFQSTVARGCGVMAKCPKKKNSWLRKEGPKHTYITHMLVMEHRSNLSSCLKRQAK